MNRSKTNKRDRGNGTGTNRYQVMMDLEQIVHYKERDKVSSSIMGDTTVSEHAYSSTERSG